MNRVQIVHKNHCNCKSRSKQDWGLAIARLLVSVFFVSVGTLHFTRPAGFVQIVPEILPGKKELVYLSGAFEILGGLGLLCSRTRSFAGNGLVALLLAVFPANINMAINRIDFGFLPHLLLWARLPLQFVMIYIVHKVSKDPKAG
ncbi:MAG TPA: DoxX family membrane protein [Oculatellaceae cyanobacterium]